MESVPTKVLGRAILRIIHADVDFKYFSHGACQLFSILHKSVTASLRNCQVQIFNVTVLKCFKLQSLVS